METETKKLVSMKKELQVEEQKVKIIEASIGLFNEYGLKFTMDQLAENLKMSKKTLYTVFDSKQKLMDEAVDYFFDSIRISKQQVLEEKGISLTQRLSRLLSAMPDSYSGINFQQLYMLRDKYPKVYSHMTQRLESDWEPTIALLEQGIASGELRSFSIPVFKTMMEASLERFFQNDVLVRSGITYGQALQQVVEILIDGIRA